MILLEGEMDHPNSWGTLIYGDKSLQQLSKVDIAGMSSLSNSFDSTQIAITRHISSARKGRLEWVSTSERPHGPCLILSLSPYPSQRCSSRASQIQVILHCPKSLSPPIQSWLLDRPDAQEDKQESRYNIFQHLAWRTFSCPASYLHFRNSLREYSV